MVESLRGREKSQEQDEALKHPVADIRISIGIMESRSFDTKGLPWTTSIEYQPEPCRVHAIGIESCCNDVIREAQTRESGGQVFQQITQEIVSSPKAFVVQ